MNREQRKEFLDLLEKTYADIRAVLETDEVLPSSVTSNGGRVGVTIKLRRLYDWADVSSLPSPEPMEELS